MQVGMILKVAGKDIPVTSIQKYQELWLADRSSDEYVEVYAKRNPDPLFRRDVKVEGIWQEGDTIFTDGVLIHAHVWELGKSVRTTFNFQKETLRKATSEDLEMVTK